ncbi:MAG: hypothetical protein AAGA30_17600 [Planctomycetota bacterium]
METKPSADRPAASQLSPTLSTLGKSLNQPYFEHPNRFPGNADGPFYTTGHVCVGETKFNGMMADCLQCEAPEYEAPDLLAELTNGNLNTYFVRQPSTPDEIDRACNAIGVCCVSALRYGGRDRDIIRRLGNTPEFCDYIIDNSDQLKLTVGENGELLPFASAIVEMLIRDRKRRRGNGG